MGDGREEVAYTCHRADGGPIVVDGDLDKDAWARVPRTPRFGQMGSGRVTPLATEAALLWDDSSLYVAFWLEERDVWSTGEARSALEWQENTVEVAIAGPGAYYNLCLNAAGQMSELFFIWKDSYERGGRYDVPEFDLAVQRPMVFGGDAEPHDERGLRWGFLDWRFPGLQAAVRVDGTLNERGDVDIGWTAELMLPWEGMRRLADGPLPPHDGDTWRIALARNEVVDQRATRHTATWTWMPMGEHGMHGPERYPQVRFTTPSSPTHPTWDSV